VAKPPDADRDIELAILYYIRERVKEHRKFRRGPKDRFPKLYLHWIADVIANEMNDFHPFLDATRSMPGAPHTPEPTANWYLGLKFNNRRRVVQAALDRLVLRGDLIAFKWRVRRRNSVGREQVFRENCYRPPTSLLEAIAFAAR